MKNDSLKKIFLIIISIAFTFSCESNDSIANNVDKQILKKITSGVNGQYLVHFNDKGLYSLTESTRFSNPIKISELIYNSDKLINRKSYSNSGTLMASSDYFYDNENNINSIKVIIYGLPDNEYVINLSYQDNTITGYTFENQSGKHKVVFTFTDSEYSKLERYEVYNSNNNIKLFEEVFSYSVNNNLIDSTILVGEDNTRSPNIYSYDNQKNPYTESNKKYFLHSIINPVSFGSLKGSLAIWSPNNLNTLVNGEGRVELEYDNKDYPTKETSYNDSDEIINIRTFEYY